jgi:hypothetical protein
MKRIYKYKLVPVFGEQSITVPHHSLILSVDWESGNSAQMLPANY